MFKEIKSIDEFLTVKAEKAAVLAYFSTDDCSVCKVLKPKVEEMAKEEFPNMYLAFVKLEALPEIAARISVFTVPVIVVFFNGRETIRKSRSIGITQLQHEIARYYSMLFD